MNSKGNFVTTQWLCFILLQGSEMLEESDRGDWADQRDLEHLISTYNKAQAIWLATAARNGDLVAEGKSFEALETASRALLHYPCKTFAAVRRKVSFVLDTDDLYTMVREDEDETGEILRIFLSSLIAQHSASESCH